MQCGALWCCVVLCGAVWCGAVRCSLVQYGAVWCCVVQCGAVWCGVALYLVPVLLRNRKPLQLQAPIGVGVVAPVFPFHLHASFLGDRLILVHIDEDSAVSVDVACHVMLPDCNS